MSNLKPMPVVPESMEHGKYYIWSRGDGRFSVVVLEPNGDAMIEQHYNNDVWFFEDQLIGCLYGPIAIPFPSIEEEQ